MGKRGRERGRDRWRRENKEKDGERDRERIRDGEGGGWNKRVTRCENEYDVLRRRSRGVCCSSSWGSEGLWRFGWEIFR